jgi:EpsI family protein
VISWNARFAIVAVLMTTVALFEQTRRRHDIVASPALSSSFPARVGYWVGTDIPLPSDILESLGNGDFLLRAYQDQVASQPEVDLYVAYWPDQLPGQRRHLPLNCLVGSGWTLLESDTTKLAGLAPFEANRYLIAKGSERQLVIFWYWARGRRVASVDHADFYRVLDSLRLNRNDDALIRVNTPLGASESPDDAQQRLGAFLSQANPLFDQHIPR